MLEKQLLTIVVVIKKLQKELKSKNTSIETINKTIKELSQRLDDTKELPLKELRLEIKSVLDTTQNDIKTLKETLQQELSKKSISNTIVTKDLSDSLKKSVEEIENKLSLLITQDDLKKLNEEIDNKIKNIPVKEDPVIKVGKVHTVGSGDEANVEVIKKDNVYTLEFYIPRGVSGRGQNGKGIATGGTTNQVLTKASNEDYDTKWVTGGTGTQIQTDWNQTNTEELDYIKNKPTIPTKTSELTNDSGFINDISSKQDTLVSGTNIKTVNNTSLLGNGNIDIGGSYTLPTASDTVLGGIKVGARLSIVDSVLSADVQTTDISGKVDKEAGKGLSANDFTDALETKLNGIEAGAEVNNISDVNVTDLTDGGATTLHKHSYTNLDNKPTIPTDVSNLTDTTGIIPTTTNDLTNNSGFISNETDPLFTAWDKDYADLINKPTIPSALASLTDDATHRTVTDTEKSTWNGKQPTPIEVTVATAYNTATKVGTTTSGAYTPILGDILIVTFSLGCSVSTPTLNIDGSGAKNIRVANTNVSTTHLSTTASTIIMLWYDGTYYQLFGSTVNTTYSEITDANLGNTTSTSTGLISGRRMEYYKNNSLIIDEDDMISNSATKMPSQQSTKAYVDSSIAGVNTIIENLNLSNYGVTATSDELNILDGATLTTTELNYVDGVTSSIQTQISNIWQTIYPVGAIYISVSSTSPATLFGGIWEVFGAGRTLVGINSADTDFDTVEETRGAKTVTLDTTMIPSHNHGLLVAGQGGASAFALTVVNPGAQGGFNLNYCNSAGGGQAHDNIQPSIVVYMWKRTE